MGKSMRIPLVLQANHRGYDDSDSLPAISGIDQRIVNAIFRRDVNQATNTVRWRVCKRPGIENAVALSNVATGAYTACQVDRQTGGYGFFSVWPSTTANNVRLVTGNSVGSNIAVTGVVACSRLRQYYDSSSNEQLVFHLVTGVAANRKAFTTTSGGTETEITDADYPKANAIGNFAFLDGYLFIMTDKGAIYNSDVNSSANWTSTSFIYTQKQDQGRGLFHYRDKIGAFGSDYIEFYENVGATPGSPLQQVDQLRVKDHGLYLKVGSSNVSMDTGHLYYEAMDTVFWLNSSETTVGAGVFMLEGFTPKKISSPMVDFDLARNFDAHLSIRGVFNLFGQNYLVIATGDQATDYVWVYCFANGTWTTWTSALFAGSAFGGIVNGRSDAAGEQDNIYVFSGTGFYSFDVASMLSTDMSFTDNSAAYTMTIQTRNIDLDTDNRKRLNKLRLVGLDPRAASITGISYSDDDYQTFSTVQNVDMNDGRGQLTRLGTFRKRAFRITNAANTPCELEALELDLEVLRN